MQQHIEVLGAKSGETGEYDLGYGDIHLSTADKKNRKRQKQVP